MNTNTHITMDDAHTFAQGLIANGWLNEDPNCVDTLFRQLIDVTRLPAGYELAISAATPEMVRAAQATGVNAAWSYAKCYRNMLDAQPICVAPAASALAPAMSPQVLKTWLASGVCTCPGAGDGSLRWPCPTHPPEQKTCCTQDCNQGRNCPKRRAVPAATVRSDTRQAIQHALDQCATAALQGNNDAD